MGLLGQIKRNVAGWRHRVRERVRDYVCRRLAETKTLSGQGTTEYAIIVGVLVVIAILAITLFRDKIQELWNAITEGINGL